MVATNYLVFGLWRFSGSVLWVRRGPVDRVSAVSCTSHVPVSVARSVTVLQPNSNAGEADAKFQISCLICAVVPPALHGTGLIL